VPGSALERNGEFQPNTGLGFDERLRLGGIGVAEPGQVEETPDQEVVLLWGGDQVKQVKAIKAALE
jgi:hypothetical protein